MSRYLIDTNWVVDALFGQKREQQGLLDLAPAGLAISIVTYGELYEGAYYARVPDEALSGLHSFLEGKELLLLTPSIMERFAVLRGSLSKAHRQQIGDLDLLIGATALHYGLTLLTNNLRDFALIPDLQIYKDA